MSSDRKLILLFGLISIQICGINAIQCYQCDSDTDENCATLNGEIDSLRWIQCIGNCSVWIDGSRTLRGCETDRPVGIEQFENCEIEDCNHRIFPENRLKCIKCSENDLNCFFPTTSLLYPCRNYKPNDLCYTIIQNNGVALRGCISDQDDNVKVCESFGDECIKCDQTFCNSVSGKRNISCIECYDNDSCGYTQNFGDTSQSLRVSTTCEVYLGRVNNCFAFTNQTTYIRGCLNDFPDLKSSCEENTEFCQICNDDFCNDMKMIAEYCVECDSTSCKSTPNVVVPTLCGEATFDRGGCYLNDKGDIIFYSFIAKIV